MPPERPRADHRADAPTSKIEKIEVAISIIGSAVTSSEVRNNASRVAFPPTNCAVTDGGAAHGDKGRAGS